MFRYLIGILILFIIPIVLLIFISKYLKNKTGLDTLFKNTAFLILLIILWTIIGFFSKLDYDQQCGCFISNKSIFEFENILYSSISIILLLFSLINIKVRKSFVIFESVIWLFKLVILKSGYAVGIAGIPNLLIFFYDFIGLLLRILTISVLFKKIKIKTIYILIITGIILVIKILFFACQDDFIKQKYITPYLSDKLIIKLKGEWAGTANWKLLLYENNNHFPLNYRDSSLHLKEYSNLEELKGNIEKSIDTIFVPISVNPQLKDNQRIVEKESKIIIKFSDSTILINGLEYLINKEYHLYFIEPSFNPIIYYSYSNKNKKQFLENSKLKEIQLYIKDLENKYLIGSLNGLIIIKLKKNE